ncbi:MAG TPA: protein phosphatase 2C domain-containing protein [Vicinamibacterales bacterium]|jgi:protein phosphatase|nr:protein phosphatase 2C domain-containing protein [Vicinamibacterales bacterium]
MDTEDEHAQAARRRLLSPILQTGDFRTLASSVEVELGACSHRGKRQQHNDDHYLAIRLGRSQTVLETSLTSAEVPRPFEEYAYAMLVADGIGSSGAGGLASRIALSTFAHLALHYGHWNIRIDSRTAADVMDRAERLYERVNDTVLKRGMEHAELQGMATTLTAAYSAGNDLFIAHVGHSRAYYYREGELTQLTVDHTLEERMAHGAKPQSLEAGSQDLGHILTDTIGGRAGAPEIAIDRFTLKDGDRLMLCTNGLTDALDDGRIADVLCRRRQPKEECRSLVDRALERGGEDNITVVLADYRIPPI